VSLLASVQQWWKGSVRRVCPERVQVQGSVHEGVGWGVGSVLGRGRGRRCGGMGGESGGSLGVLQKVVGEGNVCVCGKGRDVEEAPWCCVWVGMRHHKVGPRHRKVCTGGKGNWEGGRRWGHGQCVVWSVCVAPVCGGHGGWQAARRRSSGVRKQQSRSGWYMGRTASSRNAAECFRPRQAEAFKTPPGYGKGRCPSRVVIGVGTMTTKCVCSSSPSFLYE